MYSTLLLRQNLDAHDTPPFTINPGPNKDESYQELKPSLLFDLILSCALTATLINSCVLSSNLKQFTFFLRVVKSFFLIWPRLMIVTES